MPNAKFQGTDGVRGLVVDEDHPQAAGVEARAAFLENGVLTARFIEHYVFEAGAWLLERASEQLISPTAVVLAWDPRDAEELSAALRERSSACGRARALARRNAHPGGCGLSGGRGRSGRGDPHRLSQPCGTKRRENPFVPRLDEAPPG